MSYTISFEEHEVENNPYFATSFMCTDWRSNVRPSPPPKKNEMYRDGAATFVIVLTKDRTDCHPLTTDFYVRSDKDSVVG